MTQAPLVITTAHIKASGESFGRPTAEWLALVCNKALEIALAERATQGRFITADEARALGAGNAEWYDDYRNTWELCDADSFDPAYLYRAIRKEVPAEPHAKLRALYAQQVKDGTWINHVWAYCDRGKWTDEVLNGNGAGSGFRWTRAYQYRCTPKANLVNLDGVDMTREAAIAICHAVLAPTKASAAEVPTPFRGAYISGVNRCINRLGLLND